MWGRWVSRQERRLWKDEGAQRLQASDIRFQGCVNKGSGSWGAAFTLGGGFHLGEMSR